MICFSPEAEADFVAVIRYLSEREPVAAAALGARVFQIIDRLAAGELEGPERVLGAGARVRSWPVPPLRVYYQRRGDKLWVLRIYHQARAPIVR